MVFASEQPNPAKLAQLAVHNKGFKWKTNRLQYKLVHSPKSATDICCGFFCWGFNNILAGHVSQNYILQSHLNCMLIISINSWARVRSLYHSSNNQERRIIANGFCFSSNSKFEYRQMGNFRQKGYVDLPCSWKVFAMCDGIRTRFSQIDNRISAISKIAVTKFLFHNG